MIGLRRSVDARRARELRRATPGPLRDFLSTPSPPRSTPLDELPLLAVDIETTGLRPRSDRILSVGWVPLEGGRINLVGAGGMLIRDPGEVGQSATVHGLTDDALVGGVDVAEAVGMLLAALRGRALLAHFARIETGFVGATCERLWGGGLPVEVVDTLELERRALGPRWDPAVNPDAVRLWAARERRGLPTYRAHEAVTDALACAELYLAQRAHLGDGGRRATRTLGDVVS